MDEVCPTDAAVDAFVSGISVVSAEFAEQVGREITLGELLEILGAVVPGHEGDPVRFTVVLGRGSYVGSGESRVADLNDSVFVEASEALSRLLGGQGMPGPLTRLTSFLKPALDEIEVSDVGADSIVRLSAVAPGRASGAEVGDIVAIPLEAGGHRRAVVVAKNRFGTALGLLRGVFDGPRPHESRSPMSGIPLYTDEHLIRSGAWRLLGRDDSVVESLPRKPEIYHEPGLWPHMDLGPFGAAETAGGEIRLLGEEEADAVGLGDGSYRQVYGSEYLQTLLDRGFDGVGEACDPGPGRTCGR